MKMQRRFSPEFKRQVVEGLLSLRKEDAGGLKSEDFFNKFSAGELDDTAIHRPVS